MAVVDVAAVAVALAVAAALAVAVAVFLLGGRVRGAKHRPIWGVERG